MFDEIEAFLRNRPQPMDRSRRWNDGKLAAGTVVKTLHSLATAIAGAKDPEAKDAIILIKAISANLTESPDTLQSVNELERYLVTDDIIEEAESENGFRH